MKSNGFTLIELMIVVAIVGILAIAAIPAYKAYSCEATPWDKECIEYKARKEHHVVSKKSTCIRGYAFTSNGTQIIGVNGGGVPCQN